jgi:hypothetical protein
MARVSYKDTQEILTLFETEMSQLGRLTKLEKMKMRRRISNVVQPALSTFLVTPELFMGTVEEKLSDVLSQFRDRWEFRNKLQQKISDVVSRGKDSAAFCPLPEFETDWLKT